MQRAGAAERDEGEVARVVAALDRDDAERAQHLRVHDLDHRGRVDAGQRRGRRVAVEHEPAGELRRQPAEQQVRVGHGRAAAGAVAGGPGIGARALRPDADRPARVETDERAAAGADGVQVDGRQPDREAADDALGDALGRAAAESRQTSVDVPPMSKAIAFSNPARRATSPAPTTPAAGPETRIVAGCAAASSTEATPPDDCMTSGSGRPASRAPAASARR